MQANAFGSHEQLYGIYDFKDFIETQQSLSDADDWEPNEMLVGNRERIFCLVLLIASFLCNFRSVARRCFLEVEEKNPLDESNQGQMATAK